MLGLGFSARIREHSLLAYLSAGRALTLPAFVATLVSTWYGGILGIGDSVKVFGVGTILLNGVPYYLFGLLYAVFLARRVREADQISIPERMERQFGKPAAVVAAVLVLLLALPIAQVLMLGTMVQILTGWTMLLSVIAATAIGTLFLYRGGLLADVRAGLLAFLMMYLGFLVIVGWCLTHYPLGDVLAKLGQQNAALVSPTGGQTLVAITSFMILGAWTLVDPGFHQRVASAASPETGRRGVFVSVGFWILFDLLSTTTGMYAMVLLPADASGLSLFPRLGDSVLPSGLKAIFLCGLLGTILSAMVGYTLVSGATFGRELVGRIFPRLNDDQLKLATRAGFALSSVLAVTLALQVKNVVLDLWYNYAGMVVGALLVPVLVSYRSAERDAENPGMSPKWVAFSMATGFLFTASAFLYGKRTNKDILVVHIASEAIPLGTLAPTLGITGTLFLIGHWVAKRSKA